MKPSHEICPRALCTGCAACVNVCPKDAIRMQEDDCGYKYPLIDEAVCIDCGLCERTCPVLSPLDLCVPKKAYAVAAVDKGERQSSSSGGAASVLGRYVLEQGGTVYGCAQKNYNTIRHIRIDRVEDIVLLKGSKYVQSDILLVYRAVKEDLKAGKPVLFSGTPCQVAGLKRFLHKEYELLYTLDLICHGVPPQKMLREDIEHHLSDTSDWESRNKISVGFRWKAQFGIQFGIQIETNKSLKRFSLPSDPYITAFWTGLSFRENCHQCPYAQSARLGDFTIGDFWGLGAYEKTHFKIREGVSLVLVNTLRGERLWNSVKGRFDTEERALEEAIAGNSNLRVPSARPPRKDLFLLTYKQRGLDAACRAAISRKQYLVMSLTESLKRVRPLLLCFKKMRLWIHRING